METHRDLLLFCDNTYVEYDVFGVMKALYAIDIYLSL